MSYSLWLEADLGGPGRVEIDVLSHWNYTSNVAPMWRKAMPDTDGLAGMEGKRAGDMLPYLERGIEAMEADPAPYRAMNPDGGWGDFDSQLRMLKKLCDGFRKAPNAFVGVSR